MSNETSRVEAAAEAVDPYTMARESPLYDHWKDDVRTGITAALAAADADDLANGIRRVRVDEATVEKCAKVLSGPLYGCPPKYWDDLGSREQRILITYARAVLAAATDGADG